MHVYELCSQNGQPLMMVMMPMTALDDDDDDDDEGDDDDDADVDDDDDDDGDDDDDDDDNDTPRYIVTLSPCDVKSCLNPGNIRGDIWLALWHPVSC